MNIDAETSELVARTSAALPGFGFFFDFDGTLAPIRPNPDSVVPVPGALEALAELADRAGCCAVVSARPVAFLASRFGHMPGLELHGLYGLEFSADGGAHVVTSPEAELARPAVARAVADARFAFPGALIEDKGLSCALHYRTTPDLAARMDAWALARAELSGLRVQRGRMVIELKPAVDRDKGGTVRDRLGPELVGAWYFGDDLGDLPAFRALGAAEASRPGFVAVRVAIENPEVPDTNLIDEAQVRLRGPEDVPGLLRRILAGPTASRADRS